VPRGQRVLFSRFVLAASRGELPSPAHAALSLDIKRVYLELRPALRRIYRQARDLTALLAAAAPLGFVHLPIPVELDGRVHETLMLDFGPASVDGWLSDVVGRELGTAEADGPFDVAARRLVLDGNPIELTRLEWDVLRYLHERPGEAVARDALLNDVWGYEWTGGSNVVDVVVSAIRKKLGTHAAALETVRGVGYRLGALR
jgi:DNA-binding response OmpR family regulator